MTNLLKRWRDIGLERKLIAVFLLLNIIPLAVVGLAAYDNNPIARTMNLPDVNDNGKEEE